MPKEEKIWGVNGEVVTRRGGEGGVDAGGGGGGIDFDFEIFWVSVGIGWVLGWRYGFWLSWERRISTRCLGKYIIALDLEDVIWMR